MLSALAFQVYGDLGKGVDGEAMVYGFCVIFFLKKMIYGRGRVGHLRFYFLDLNLDLGSIF